MPQQQLDHLFVAGATEARDFKSTLSVIKQPAPQRNRNQHGMRLLQELAALANHQEQLRATRTAMALDEHAGMAISIRISPRGAIDLGTLEWRRDGIEVLSAIPAGDSEVVSVFVPDGKLSAFEQRVQSYLTKDTKPRTPGGPTKPTHAALVNAIASFRRAAFAQLWTDLAAPPADGVSWFQVWLRTGGRTAAEVYTDFRNVAGKFEMEVEQGYVAFPGRVVVAVNAARENLEAAAELLDLVAEIRLTHSTAEFFLSDLKPHEQAEWVKDLQARLVPPAGEPPYLALLDTGVNRGHPLLAPLLDNADVLAADAAWGGHDHHGHGTGMAGLAALGNLTDCLTDGQPVVVPHRLESSKIFPPHGANAQHLYGPVTAAAMLALEQAAQRNRIYAMMATEYGDTAGLPSEWSAAIDRLTCGLPLDHENPPADAHSHRLVILAAGNIAPNSWGNPNDLYPVESPAQSWNAVVVGACTELAQVDGGKWPSLVPIAQAGAVSACSRTSVMWTKTSWPFKPDVVAEGGNGCIDHAKAKSVTVGPESLRLLTTAHNYTVSALVESGDTSASTAEVARVAAHVRARYPQYWPETVRALVIQGAQITPTMRAQLPVKPQKKHKENLLRTVGFGKVDLDGSLFSTAKRATLVLQETIVPYVKEGGNIKLGKMNLHDLPWPAEKLQELGEAEVVMSVTVSYFVEPNPSRRGWQSKFRYQSHGLRFAAKGATETEERFLQRINKVERDLAEDQVAVESLPDPDGDSWTWGAQLRSRGSVHHDEWRGTAADLAAKSHIAVYPVGGWWKDWTDSEKHSTPVRYALVVTLKVASEIDVDIYTPIATQIGIAVPVA